MIQEDCWNKPGDMETLKYVWFRKYVTCEERRRTSVTRCRHSAQSKLKTWFYFFFLKDKINVQVSVSVCSFCCFRYFIELMSASRNKKRQTSHQNQKIHKFKQILIENVKLSHSIIFDSVTNNNPSHSLIFNFSTYNFQPFWSINQTGSAWIRVPEQSGSLQQKQEETL